MKNVPHETNMPHCWCDPRKEVQLEGGMVIVHCDDTCQLSMKERTHFHQQNPTSTSKHKHYFDRYFGEHFWKCQCGFIKEMKPKDELSQEKPISDTDVIERRLQEIIDDEVIPFVRQSFSSALKHQQEADEMFSLGQRGVWEADAQREVREEIVKMLQGMKVVSAYSLSDEAVLINNLLDDIITRLTT